jgi:hypothetical protein
MTSNYSFEDDVTSLTFFATFTFTPTHDYKYGSFGETFIMKCDKVSSADRS